MDQADNHVEEFHDRFLTREQVRRYRDRYLTGRRQAIDQKERVALRRLLAGVEPLANAMDIPSGTGRLTPVLAERAQRVILADTSAMMLDVAREDAPDLPADYLQTDIRHISKPDDSVDLVFSHRLLHHVYDAKLRASMFKELARVARRYVVLSYYEPSFRRRGRWWVRRLLGMADASTRPPTFAKYLQDAAEVGLDIKDEAKLRGFPYRATFLLFAKRMQGVVTCLMAALLAGACARVDPAPDFQRSAEDISQRTGVQQVYDPAADEAAADRIEELSSDGLTVEEAVQVALLNNRGFQAAFQTIGASRADVVQSGLLSNPTMAFSVRFPEGGGRSNLTVGFAQQLVDLWQIPVRRQVAEAQLEQTVMNVSQRAVELAADVRVRCYQLLALEQADGIARENLELAERSYKLALDRFTAGEVSQLDASLVRTHVLDVKKMLITLQRDRAAAELALGRVLGLSREDRPWKLNDTLDVPLIDIAPADTLVAAALQDRFDVRAAAVSIRGAEADLRRQCLNVFPNVTLGLEAERTERRAMPGRNVLADTARASTAAGQLTAPEIQSKAQRDLERRQIIDSLLGPTLEITLPLWDQNQAQIAKAQYRVQELRKEFEDMLDSVAQQMRAAVVSAEAAAELVRFYREEALPLNRSNLDSASSLYRDGEQSILVLIDAQESLIEQQRAYIDVLRDYASAMAELERALGGRLEMVATPTTQATAEYREDMTQ